MSITAYCLLRLPTLKARGLSGIVLATVLFFFKIARLAQRDESISLPKRRSWVRILQRALNHFHYDSGFLFKPMRLSIEILKKNGRIQIIQHEA